MASGTSSKLDLLLEFYKLQQKAAGLMMQSDAKKNRGDLQGAVTDYNELIATQRQQLDLTLTHNFHYPEIPFDVPPIVGPLINAMLTQADVIESLGDPDTAERLRENALEISRQHLGTADNAERQRQRAASLISRGSFNEALIKLAEVKDRFLAEGDRLNLASVAVDIAGIHEWLGDFERALSGAGQASTALAPLIPGKTPTDHDVYSSLLKGALQEAEQRSRIQRVSLEIDQICARSNRYLGNFTAAKRRFREILPKVPTDVRPAIEFQLGAVLTDEGRCDEGLAIFNRIEPLFLGLLRPKRGVLLSYRAEAFLKGKQPERALTDLDAAIQELVIYPDPDSAWKTHWRRARALTTLGRRAEAMDAYKLSAKCINDLRKAPLGYRLDSTYLKDKLPVFQDAIRLASITGQAQTCCRLMEMIKSRILTAALSIPRVVRPQTDWELENRVDELSRLIDALEYKGYRNGWVDEISQNRQSLLAKRATLLERIRFSDPRWRSVTEPVLFDLDATIDLLKTRNQAALHMFQHVASVIVVLIQNGSCKISTRNLSDEATSIIDKYRKNLQAELPVREWYDPSSGLGLTADDLVPSHLLEMATSASSLIIIPYGTLHLLPWAGLTFKKKRLFEYCPIGILPNLSCLKMLERTFVDNPKIGLIGAPDYTGLTAINKLPLALEELRTIENIYSHHGLVEKPCFGKNATVANFRKFASHSESDGNILHVVCHGSFVQGDPMNAGLLMRDARVDAAEIASTPINFDEVILSACSTGYRPTEVGGVELNGDDILGIPGVFLEAGARSILVSIPHVRDDAALQFMTIYHERRMEGKSPLTALQETQQTMHDDAYYPPFLWIGFTIYGCY